MITYSKTAQRHIKSLDPRMKERIREGIEKLPAGDVKPIQGHRGLYRLRVGTYRVIYEVKEGNILVYSVLPRGQVYKGL